MIKIKFVDFGKYDNYQYLYNFLNKRFQVELVDYNPDYVICGPFTVNNEYKNYNCTRIYYTGECHTPDFNKYDYAIGFDDISFGKRYMRYPLWLFYKNDLLKALNRHIQEKEVAFNREFCSYVVSNGTEKSVREQFYNALSEYKEVASGGRYQNNVGGPVDDKIKFQEGYKFSIAFENSKYPGYITEKILQAFASRTIPIYWGADDIIDDFNPNAFINLNNYNSFESCIDKIKSLDKNIELYNQMLNQPIFIQGSRGDQLVQKGETQLSIFFENIFSSEKIVRNESYYEDQFIKRNNIAIVPWEKIIYESVVIIGAGKIGRDYFKQLDGKKNILAIADNNYKVLGGNIIAIDELKKYRNSMTNFLISVKNEKAAISITTQLEKIGIEKDKIIWKYPDYIYL